MTLTEDRPKRLTLADLEETCRNYAKHIRREKNWMTFQLAVSIIVPLLRQGMGREQHHPGRAAHPPGRVLPHGLRLGLRAGEENVPGAGLRRDALQPAARSGL